MTWVACIGFARSFGVWSSSSLLALACGGEPAAAPIVEEVVAVPDVPAVVASIDDCEALLRSGDADDAALLPVLCPDTPLDLVTARGVLLAAGSSAEARRVEPLLRPFPELAAMARLVGHMAFRPSGAEGASTSMPTTLEDRPVTPLDDGVLAQVQLARALVHDETTATDTRTAARGYLAKAHMAALKQLGIGPTRPPPPFGRLLAAQAIYYGRSFCASFWQRQVPGLYELARATEVDLLAATLALEASHYGGDPAIVAVELSEGRRYVSRDDARVRIEKQLVGSPEATMLDPDRLAPTVSDLERLLAQGFVEQAIARGLAIASAAGLAPMEQLLRDGLQRSEGDEYRKQLDDRFAAVRKQAARPPEDGTGELDHAREAPWPTATAEADRMLEEIASAPALGFARRRALGRTVLAARRRPDALLAAIDVAARSNDAKITTALPLLRAIAVEYDDGHLRWLRRTTTSDPDTSIRQDFALGAREAAAR